MDGWVNGEDLVERVEAFDHDAEAAVLRAAMVADDQSLTYIVGYLEVEDFHRSQNRQMFAAVKEAAEDHSSLDVVTVAEYLPAPLRQHLREVAEEARRDTDNLQHWVGTIRRYAQQRKMLRLVRDVGERVAGPRWADAMWEFYDGMVEIVADASSSDGAKSISDIAPEITEILDLSRERKGVIGIRSGIWPIDMHFMGLCKGHVGILAGRPNEGKSGFAGQVTLNVATQEHRALYISTEMQARDIFLRMAFARAGVHWDRFASGDLSASDRNAVDDAMRQLGTLPMFVDDSGRHTIASIRRAVIRHRPDFLVIDYTQQIAPPAAYRDSRDREVASVADGIRSIAMSADIPVLALAQMNRQIESRSASGPPNPKLSDLRDSGVVENNADWVMFIQKPHTYDERRPEDEVLLRGRKNRHGVHKVWDESMYLDDGLMWLGGKVPDESPQPARSTPPERGTPARDDDDDFDELDLDMEDV